MSSNWWESPLRDGEYDVPVMFRVTGMSAKEARATVRAITDTATMVETTGHSHIVPMWTPEPEDGGRSMNTQQLKALCNLLMGSDPTPLSAENDRAVRDFADAESRRHGFADWITAFHSA